MKKRLISSLRKAFKHLALVAIISMNVAPAFAQYAISTPTFSYAPLEPGAFYDPTIIFQAQSPVSIYNSTMALGQIPTGATFQTQMYRDPFHYAVSGNAVDYAAMMNSAYQSPTAIGPMIPASVVEPIMLSNGTTLPAEANFYIPPSEFSYQKIHAIGARSDYEDRDIDRLMNDIADRDDRLGTVDSYDDMDDEYDRDDVKDERRYRSRRRIHEEARRESIRESIRPAKPGFYSVPDSTDSSDDDNQELVSTGAFKIVGPTCGCRSTGGRACVYGSSFGKRKHPVTGKHAHHNGMDISAGIGTPVVAVADGTISDPYIEAGYGKTMIVKHADSYAVRYAHLSRWIVKKGQRVRKGEIIGYTGNTGRTTGPHLHFEVCRLRSGETRCNKGNSVNPRQFLSNNQNSQLNQSCSALAENNSGSTSRSSGAAARSSRTGTRTTR